MSLVPDYDDSQSSSSSEEEEEVAAPRLPSPPKEKLPAPDFLANSAQTSVFKNPFAEAEDAKVAVLQKHVKMVESQEKTIVINGKKICWNYRKGRCRFGHNCKFAHDSDLQKSAEELQVEKQIQNTIVCENMRVPQPSNEELERIREEGIKETIQRKKKRPGLTQGLTPGKKVMKSYHVQKVQK